MSLLCGSCGHAETKGVVCGFLLGPVLTVEGKYQLVAKSQIYKTVVVLNAVIRKVTCLCYICDDTLDIKHFTAKKLEILQINIASNLP